jgi:hypothetical protein
LPILQGLCRLLNLAEIPAAEFRRFVPFSREVPAMTKPTRSQEQACDKLAEALVLLTEAARLDGRARFGAAELRAAADALARASTAFGLDVIVARALERRGLSLGLRSGTAEMLTLMEGGVAPLELLLLTDDDFRARVAAFEEELGEV